MMNKKLKIILYILAVLIILVVFLYTRNYGKDNQVFYGVTFSQVAAQELGLEGRETYLAVLDDLKPSKIRLATYWNQIEGEKDGFTWSYLDWQIKEAEKRGVPVVLVIGRRVPRWPECHDPTWLKNLQLKDQQQETLRWLKNTIEHYRDYKIIKVWQLENEPLLSLFGTCPPPDENFLKKEIELVKSLDKRPMMITDSGELSLWLRTSGLTDILGTTIYRSVWNKYLGYWQHIYPPAFYHWRSLFAKLKGNSKVVVSELQGEPWGAGKSLIHFSLAEQKKHFAVDDFLANVKLAQRAGFQEIYFWGAEWWYWLKKQGDDSFWRAAKELMTYNQ